MRITTLELTLRSDIQPLPVPNPPTKETEQHRFLVPLEGPPAYISLLGDEPFVVPPVLSQPLGLPSTPRLSNSSQGEFMLTPETMRYLGTTVETFTTQIHAVQLAYRGTEVRADLQRQEFKRQQEKCREMMELVEKLKGRRSGLTQYKLNALREAQKGLLKRLDRVLQALMEQASPELSEFETKWFQELKRMKEEVMGLKRFDDGSFAARTSSVSFRGRLSETGC
jgi:nucleoporin NUP82